MDILLYRGGAHGDVLCLTSVIPGLLEKYPGANIDMATALGYSQLIRYDPRLRRVYEVSVEPTAGYDLIVAPDHGLEWNAGIPVVQCRMAGVPFNPPQYFPTDEELNEAESVDIAICSNTNSDRRRSPTLDKIAVQFRDKYNVMQVDNGPNIRVRQPPLTIRQAAAVIAKAKLTVTVDTSLMHVAVALGVPTLIVFGDLTGPRNQYIGTAKYVKNPDNQTLIERITQCLA